MKYFSIETVVNAYKGFQDCMTNKSWGYLALLKGCRRSIRPFVPYKVDMDIVSNFLEDIFNLSQTKKRYNSGRSLYVVFSNIWDNYFNYQGNYSPNLYDLIVWAYRRKAFQDEITKEELFQLFSEEFNIPLTVITDCFDIKQKEVFFTNTLYGESDLKARLKQIGVNVSSDNIDAKKASVVASPGEISRGPFVQTLYAGLDITDYVLILQSDYYSLYGEGKHNSANDDGAKSLHLQQIFYGAPGTGKSNTIKKEVDEKGKLHFRTTFHPDSDYSTFVGCYKPKMKRSTITKDGITTTEEKIVYSFEPQAFTNAYVQAWMSSEDVYLIIEEINRGNCAQIFGDLFQLLDRKNGESEYPINADSSLADYLQTALSDSKRDDIPVEVKNGTKLKLPSNLYIWATMNTSDQSLFPIDSAFKRRWDWVYMPIDTKKENWHIKVGKSYYSWTQFLDKVNDELLTDETAEDKHLGFYFCKTENGEITQETFVGKVLFYLWNDVFKVYGIPLMIGSSKDWPYRKFYQTDGKVDVEKVAKLMEQLKITPEGSNENKEEALEDQ